MTRTDISEIGKQAAIERLFSESGYTNEPTVRIKHKGECFSSQKMMLEGCDFDLVYTPLKHLGYKAVLNVIGEIYASLAQPASLSVVFGLSKRFCFEEVADLWQGVLAACREHGVSQLGLDLIPSVNGLSISLAACGVQKKAVIEKIPASKNMDIICLTGHVGAAYMGLHVLEREKVAFTSTDKQPDLSRYKAVLGSYLSPEIKASVVQRFIDADAMPSRGYFLTRGLGEAVLRLTRDSGLGAKIYLDKIPISSQTFAMAQEIDMDAVTAAMNGGDDYKFIFTLPIEKHDLIRKDFQDYEVIGHSARPEVGAVLVTPEGAELPIHAQGW